MNEISENFMLSRNEQLEEQAISSIITLFAANETQNKSEEEIMALVLDTITAACDVVPRQDNDEESKKLQEFNSKLGHYIKQFRREEAATIKIHGKDLPSCINSLSRISQSFRSEPDGEWMEERMKLFIDGLTESGKKLEKKRQVCIAGVSIAALGLCLIPMMNVILDTDSENFTVMGILGLLGGAIYMFGKFVM